MTIVLVPPALGEVTSAFGQRVPGKVGSTNHQGVDYGWAKGFAVFAAAAGRVVFAGKRGGFGNLIEIDHGDGILTRYAHLRDGSLKVSVGDELRPGQHIATMGNTGTSNATHLHFELLVDGVQVDPLAHMTSAAGSGSTPLTERKKRSMFLIRHPSGAIALIGDTRAQVLTFDQYGMYRRILGADYVQVSAEEYAQAFIDAKAARKS